MRCRLFRLFAVSFVTCTVGCGMRLDSRQAEERSDAGASSEVRSSAHGIAPLKVVRGTGELGDADYGDQRACTFTVQNESGKQLTLFVADKSCACAGVDVSPATVAPLRTAEVTVHWSPKLDQSAGEEARVRTTIQAKEDSKATLTLEGRGRIHPSLFVNLPRGELDFGRMDVADLKQGRELAIEVYTQDSARKDFTLHAIAAHAGLKLTPPEPQRLTKDRMEALRAIAGYRINIQCGEGLPVGRFRETVTLESNAYPDRALEVAVTGWVESGAVTVNPEAVSLPEAVPLATGYKAPPLEITLRGEPDRTLTFVRAQPSFLQVQVEPVQSNVWRVRVSIPATEAELGKALSSEELQKVLTYGFGDGYLLFSTSHSRLPTLSVPVPGRRFQR